MFDHLRRRRKGQNENCGKCCNLQSKWKAEEEKVWQVVQFNVKGKNQERKKDNKLSGEISSISDLQFLHYWQMASWDILDFQDCFLQEEIFIPHLFIREFWDWSRVGNNGRVGCCDSSIQLCSWVVLPLLPTVPFAGWQNLEEENKLNSHILGIQLKWTCPVCKKLFWNLPTKKILVLTCVW